MTDVRFVPSDTWVFHDLLIEGAEAQFEEVFQKVLNLQDLELSSGLLAGHRS
jgi:hypothetical protein